MGIGDKFAHRLVGDHLVKMCLGGIEELAPQRLVNERIALASRRDHLALFAGLVVPGVVAHKHIDVFAAQPLNGAVEHTALEIGQAILVQKRLHDLLVSRAAVGADAQLFAVLLGVEEIGCRALGVAGGVQAEDLGVAQLDDVAVVQIDIGQKALEISVILLEHIDLGTAFRHNTRHTVRVVAVSVGEQDHLDILHVIAENGQRIDDHIGRLTVADVDQNQSVARIDHVGRGLVSTDKVAVSRKLAGSDIREHSVILHI